MPKFIPPTVLLEPLTATTPLAALLNEWLAALAPVACLTSPRQRSLTRSLLADLTLHLHHLHYALERVKELVVQGSEEKDLRKYLRTDAMRPGIGANVREGQRLLAFVTQSHRLTTKQHLQWLRALSYPYLRKINSVPNPFSTMIAQLKAVWSHSQTLRTDLEMMYLPYLDTTRAEVVAKIEALLALDLTMLCPTS